MIISFRELRLIPTHPPFGSTRIMKIRKPRLSHIQVFTEPQKKGGEFLYQL